MRKEIKFAKMILNFARMGFRPILGFNSEKGVAELRVYSREGIFLRAWSGDSIF